MPYVDRIDVPGKFEGERTYVPYFWELFLEGMADEDEDGVLTFKVEAEDVNLYSTLAGHEVVSLVEDNQGFVYEV